MPAKVLSSSSVAELISTGAFLSSALSAGLAGGAAGAAGAAAFGAWAQAIGSAMVAVASSVAMASAMILLMGRLLTPRDRQVEHRRGGISACGPDMTAPSGPGQRPFRRRSR